MLQPAWPLPASYARWKRSNSAFRIQLARLDNARARFPSDGSLRVQTHTPPGAIVVRYVVRRILVSGPGGFQEPSKRLLRVGRNTLPAAEADANGKLRLRVTSLRGRHFQFET